MKEKAAKAKDGKETEEPEKKGKSKLYLAIALVVLIAVAASAYMILSVKPPSNGGGGGEISIDDDPVLGDANAKVTIVEFSEFECPFCGRFARDTFPQLKADYIDSGKAKFVFRDYIVHPDAHLASEASDCAYEQGNDKYWLYNEKLFNNQAALDSASLKGYASDLGLDTSQFNACLDSGKYSSEVDKDTNDGRSYGVTGTPTFFINGKKIVGAQPYSAFQQAIEAALNA
jgi:protein-disulfide isomerase